jgi:hypothetical protein
MYALGFIHETSRNLGPQDKNKNSVKVLSHEMVIFSMSITFFVFAFFVLFFLYVPLLWLTSKPFSILSPVDGISSCSSENPEKASYFSSFPILE